MLLRRVVLAVLTASSALVACGPKAPEDVHSLGGTVQGLTSSGLVLVLDGRRELEIPADATEFTFGWYEQGGSYDVQVKTQPAGQSCTVYDGQGTMGPASNRSIAVFCSSEAHRIGGTMRGLGEGESVTLLLNGAPFSVSADGAYQFPNAIPYQADFIVTVAASPAGKICTAANASGTMGHEDRADVDVTCTACGNGAVDAGEVCDAGERNGATTCPYGQSTCELCSADCLTPSTAAGAYCGDGARNGNEACDSGAQNGATSCPYGQATCQLCNADCSAAVIVQGEYCGDMILNSTAGEQCDDAASFACGTCSGPSTPAACRTAGLAVATGSITVVSPDLLGVTFTLFDGESWTKFQFVTTTIAPDGTMAIDLLGATDVTTIAQRIVSAVNRAGISIVANAGSGPSLQLSNMGYGIVGNAPIELSPATPALRIVGMEGGIGCSSGMRCRSSRDCVGGVCTSGVCR